MANIAIIGAGISGLAAANVLKTNNKIDVFEARDRAGGRIYTDHTLNAPVDLGASWIQGINNNPMYLLAQKLKISNLKTDPLSVSLYDGAGNKLDKNILLELDQEVHALEAYNHEKSIEYPASMTLSDGVNRYLKEYKVPHSLKPYFIKHFDLYVRNEYAAELNSLSCQYYDSDGAYLGGDNLIHGGFSRIIDYLVDDLSIKYNSLVKQVDYRNKKVVLQINNNTEEFDYVVVTCPLSLLKLDKIKFIPNLPEEKYSSISRLGISNFFKLAVEFPNPFWDRDTHFIEIIGEKWGTFINYDLYTNKPILIGILTGNNAYSAGTLPDEILLDEMLKSLKTLYGSKVSEPINYVKSDWGQDQLSLGSYTYIPPGSFMEDYAILAKSVANKVFFAGDATHSTYPNTTHGAYMSGIRAANEIQLLL